MSRHANIVLTVGLNVIIAAAVQTLSIKPIRNGNGRQKNGNRNKQHALTWIERMGKEIGNL
jgi:hypothetical protein